MTPSRVHRFLLPQSPQTTRIRGDQNSWNLTRSMTAGTSIIEGVWPLRRPVGELNAEPASALDPQEVIRRTANDGDNRFVTSGSYFGDRRVRSHVDFEGDQIGGRHHPPVDTPDIALELDCHLRGGLLNSGNLGSAFGYNRSGEAEPDVAVALGIGGPRSGDLGDAQKGFGVHPCAAAEARRFRTCIGTQPSRRGNKNPTAISLGKGDWLETQSDRRFTRPMGGWGKWPGNSLASDCDPCPKERHPLS